MVGRPVLEGPRIGGERNDQGKGEPYEDVAEMSICKERGHPRALLLPQQFRRSRAIGPVTRDQCSLVRAF